MYGKIKKLKNLQKMKNYLAFDLGATSGRCILGTLDNGKVTTEELSRFRHERIISGEHQFWDFSFIFGEIKRGLAIASEKGIHISSVGIDTWGVDFVCLDKNGNVIGNPHSYRDPMTEPAMKEYLEKHRSPLDLYMSTGIQLMNFNTIFQLYAMKQSADPVIESADSILFLPDALTYMLTGVKVWEHTIASTSQLLNPSNQSIDPDLADEIGVGKSLFGRISEPGTVAGYIKKEILEEAGIDYEIPVISVAGHDTASAIAAIPALADDFAYISSGTWSLVGIETDYPVISEKTFGMSLTNETGYAKKNELLSNITGMWVLEECMKQWNEREAKAYKYEDIVCMANEIPSFLSLIDPDHEMFRRPDNMPEAIKSYCRKTGQHVPANDREMVECIFASLALKYKYTVDSLQEITGKQISTLHIIGGGSKNDLMSRYSCDATGLDVVTGPAEGASFGNILVQAAADNEIKSLPDIRKTMYNSIATKSFKPRNTEIWERAYKDFRKLASL